jgi:cation:H+ antiporter
MVYVLFVLGFAVLIIGANVLVDGASSIGRKLKMSPIVIGFTIVALGTSLPELIINVFASARGETDLAITNVLGSNIMNTLFIIGASAFIFHIIPGKRTIWSLVPISLFASFLLMIFANYTFFGTSDSPVIDSIEGGIFILCLIAYLYFSYRFSKSDDDSQLDEIKEFSTFKSISLIAAGAAGLYFGGNWVVDGAMVIAGEFGMSTALMGITIVAVATSLPELVTSVIAALKKNSGIALGNALGSNIFNIFLVLGISSIIRPLPFNTALNFDIAIMLVSSIAVTFFVYVGRGKMITKPEGGIMMALYILYISWLVFRV